MLNRFIFGTPTSSESDHDLPAAPHITVTDVYPQPETAPERDLRRSDRASNLLDLVDGFDEEIGTQFTSSTFVMVRTFAAAASGNTAAVSAIRLERREASSVLPMRKGYELEEPVCFIANKFVQTILHDDAEESSSEYDAQPAKQDNLAVPSTIHSGKNSTDPDSLENLWNRNSPK